MLPRLLLKTLRWLHSEHYPYLLVNIGSGVSMVRVDGENKFTRVSGGSAWHELLICCDGSLLIATEAHLSSALPGSCTQLLLHPHHCFPMPDEVLCRHQHWRWHVLGAVQAAHWDGQL